MHYDDTVARTKHKLRSVFKGSTEGNEGQAANLFCVKHVVTHYLLGEKGTVPLCVPALLLIKWCP